MAGELTDCQATPDTARVSAIETIGAETVVGALSQPARRLLGILRAVRNSR